MTEKSVAQKSRKTGSQKTDEDAEIRRAGAIGISLILSILALGGFLLLVILVFGWRLRRRIQRAPEHCPTVIDPLWHLRHGTDESDPTVSPDASDTEIDPEKS